MIFTIYDKKFLKKTIAWLVIVAIVMKVTHAAAALTFPFAALSLLLRNKSVYLLALILVMITHQVGTTYFFPNTVISMMSIRCSLLLVSLIMSTKLFGSKVSPLVKPFGGIFIYIAWEAIVSCQGFSPVVSYLKLILFSLIYLAFMAVANDVVLLRNADSRIVRSIVLTFAVFFLIGSVMVIPFPGISLMTYGEYDHKIQIESLFKGLTSHSQALGPMVALFSTIVLSDLIFAVKKLDKLYLALIIAAPILIFKSGSRTAMGTYLGSMMVVGLLLIQSREIGGVWKHKILSTFFMAFVLLLIVFVSVPRYREKLYKFVLKKSDSISEVVSSDLTAERILSSRMGTMVGSMSNFCKKPLTGNGFQVVAEMESSSRDDASLMSYFSAPIEKGVWVTAVLEEGGLPGLLFFAGFLVYAFCSLVRQKAYASASTLFSATLSNLGEFNFFSMTYTGGLIWALIFTAVVMDSQRLNETRQLQSFPIRPMFPPTYPMRGRK